VVVSAMPAATGTALATRLHAEKSISLCLNDFTAVIIMCPFV
jgi:hypothetical protein